MLQYARLFARGGYLEDFRTGRDIVLMDQRGTGESNGLYCAALNEQLPFERYYTKKKVRTCREQVADQRNLLPHLSTLDAVDDLEDVRKWLGYTKFDVGGWSYGSRFMLTYASRYLSSIRSIVLAVPSPFDYRRPVEWAHHAQSALDGMLQDCNQEPGCRTAFPDLSGDWATLLERVDRFPPSLEYTDPKTGDSKTFRFDRDVLIDLVHGALLKVRPRKYLPLLIHEAAKGNFAPFIEFALSRGPPTRSIAEPQYLSVVCPEETALIDFDEARTASDKTFVGTHFAEEFQMACREWGLRRHGQYPLDGAAQDIPALVISGNRDPILPDRVGARIAASLKNSRHIVVSGMPHDFGGMEGSACLEKLVTEFVERPNDLRTLDISCVESIRAPPFITDVPAPPPRGLN